MNIPCAKPRTTVKQHLPESVKHKLKIKDNVDDDDDEDTQTIMVMDSNIEDEILKAVTTAQEF